MSTYGDERLTARFWGKVIPAGDNECWIWQGCLYRNGYGQFRLQSGVVRAHRLAYSTLVGPIPEGLTIDHLCRVRTCVNPAHMEIVTAAENTLRNNAPNMIAHRAGTCRKGHPVDRGSCCRPCAAERRREYMKDPEVRARRNRIERERQARLRGARQFKEAAS